MDPFPENIFPNIKAPKVPNNLTRNLSSCFLVSCFTVSLTLPFNTLEFYDFMILIISSIYSFGKTKAILFSALRIFHLCRFLWIVPSIAVDNCTLLSFISMGILLAEAFFILAFCLVVRNNSCSRFSSWKFFLVIVNVVLALFFAADFCFFSWLFVSLTLYSS